ncbi:hypothetical protein KIPB_012146, partial [Kipferlia bialata]|eukprot:g12146.t1
MSATDDALPEMPLDMQDMADRGDQEIGLITATPLRHKDDGTKRRTFRTYVTCHTCSCCCCLTWVLLLLSAVVVVLCASTVIQGTIGWIKYRSLPE